MSVWAVENRYLGRRWMWSDPFSSSRKPTPSDVIFRVKKNEKNHIPNEEIAQINTKSLANPEKKTEAFMPQVVGKMGSIPRKTGGQSYIHLIYNESLQVRVEVTVLFQKHPFFLNQKDKWQLKLVCLDWKEKKRMLNVWYIQKWRFGRWFSFELGDFYVPS